MSIANEVQRILVAKDELKTELMLRGANVENDTLDTFASKLRELMHCIKGEWTPEEDADSFGISGLSFCPEIAVVFNRELHSIDITEAINLVVMIDDSTGYIRYRKSDGLISNANVSPSSPVFSWSDTGCTVNLPANTGCFKAGYSYEYYILGRSL